MRKKSYIDTELIIKIFESIPATLSSNDMIHLRKFLCGIRIERAGKSKDHYIWDWWPWPNTDKIAIAYAKIWFIPNDDGSNLDNEDVLYYKVFEVKDES